jgi:hypothetical protein
MSAFPSVQVQQKPSTVVVISYKEEASAQPARSPYVSKQRVYQELVDYFGKSTAFLKKKNQEIFG